MKLSTEQWARMSRLLDEVLDLDDAGRRAWLAALPPEHADIAPALRRGLFPDEDSVDVISTAALENIRAGIDLLAGSGLEAGALVGPYRLVRPLGAGGMAEVWLAQRADGAFKRQVALKIPVRLDQRKGLARRFAVERDILAALEHPHIARFYDAGVSEDGRPYLALEYVAGKNLLHWSDERQLGVRERVLLMLQVLQAVEYAHGKGVLHRDIKPNNLLVTDAGQVTLLDFGVAKATEESPDDEAAAELTTMFGRALTPGYASPEHVRGEPLSAASDVYSLGVVLHELLTGRRPVAVEGEQASRRCAFALPSAQLNEEAAGRRGGTVAQIVRSLRGDLDAIVLKALSEAPADRYASAAALAQDLRNYLAGYPVDAVAGSFGYRAGKFLRRHRLAAASAAALAIAAAGFAWSLADTPQPAGTAPAQTMSEPPPVAPAIADIKSIAVLPFADLSEKRDQEYLAEGLSDELIDRLARSPNLRVIARTSAFAFKGTNEDVRSIGAKLGVAYVLTGSVRKSDNVLRVSAQLVHAADASQIWSQTYERAPTDVFKVQDEIAGRVASALQAVLDPAAHRAAKEPKLEAYNLVLQADVYTNGPFKRDAERAEVLYRKAIALDPNYALPWARLGLLYMKQARLSWAPRNEANAEARRVIETALQLDPTLLPAHAAQFQYLLRVAHRRGEARAVLDRMRAIDMHDPLLLPECEALFASVSGNLEEAVRIQRQILDRDPLNSQAIGTLAFYLFHSDRFEDAIALFRRELQLNPHAVENHSLIGVALALLGRGDHALAAIAEEPHEGYRLWAASIALWTLGREQESDAALKGLMEKFPEASAYYIARVHALRERRNLAFEWLAKACVGQQGGCENLRSDRFFRTLHDEPRYKALLARLYPASE